MFREGENIRLVRLIRSYCNNSQRHDPVQDRSMVHKNTDDERLRCFFTTRVTLVFMPWSCNPLAAH